MKKRIKKLAELSLLIGIRQIWKLGCNVYQLINQPYLAVKRMMKEKDKSQILLMLVVTVAPTAGYLLLRIGYDKARFGFIQPGYGKVFWGAIGAQLMIWGFGGYWFWRVIKNR